MGNTCGCEEGLDKEEAHINGGAGGGNMPVGVAPQQRWGVGGGGGGGS